MRINIITLWATFSKQTHKVYAIHSAITNLGLWFYTLKHFPLGLRPQKPPSDGSGRPQSGVDHVGALASASGEIWIKQYEIGDGTLGRGGIWKNPSSLFSFYRLLEVLLGTDRHSYWACWRSFWVLLDEVSLPPVCPEHLDWLPAERWSLPWAQRSRGKRKRQDVTFQTGSSPHGKIVKCSGNSNRVWTNLSVPFYLQSSSTPLLNHCF